MITLLWGIWPKRWPAQEQPDRCPLCGHKVERVILPLEKDREIMLCANHETMMRFNPITRKPIVITWPEVRVIDADWKARDDGRDRIDENVV